MFFMQIWIIHKLGQAERIMSIYSQIVRITPLSKVNLITTEDFNDLVIRYPSTLPIDAIPTDYKLRQLRPQEVSVFKKHYMALKEISISTHKLGFILEDDIQVIDYNQLNLFWNKVNSTTFLEGYDLVFFGDGMHIPTTGVGPVEPLHTWHKTKCADSYYVTRKAASLIVEDYKLFPPFMPYDWDMSFRIHRLNLKVVWIQPGLTSQGSQTGKFPSLIQ
jgi:GR25 family glycosyltransferase involved in LPS biosynthesis